MIFCAIVVGIVLVIFIIFSLYLSASKEGFYIGLICGMVISILAVAEILLIYNISEGYKPQAIDVYRGNTELEIHSINNIPQDTVVVWKGGKQ